MRAYYECAFSRFVDIVCASLDGELFVKCRNGLVPTVKEHFRATDPGGKFLLISLSGTYSFCLADERLAILVAANPQDELRRLQLKTEMETILKAQEHLEGLPEDE